MPRSETSYANGAVMRCSTRRATNFKSLHTQRSASGHEPRYNLQAMSSKTCVFFPRKAIVRGHSSTRYVVQGCFFICHIPTCTKAPRWSQCGTMSCVSSPSKILSWIQSQELTICVKQILSGRPSRSSLHCPENRTTWTPGSQDDREMSQLRWPDIHSLPLEHRPQQK